MAEYMKTILGDKLAMPVSTNVIIIIIIIPSISIFIHTLVTIITILSILLPSTTTTASRQPSPVIHRHPVWRPALFFFLITRDVLQLPRLMVHRCPHTKPLTSCDLIRNVNP
jgi:hypothetical protein